jgi:hypothetical protein
MCGEATSNQVVSFLLTRSSTMLGPFSSTNYRVTPNVLQKMRELLQVLRLSNKCIENEARWSNHEASSRKGVLDEFQFRVIQTLTPVLPLEPLHNRLLDILTTLWYSAL